MIKKTALILLRAYIGPFAVTFAVAIFIFIMQFLWKYVDDMMGKGLDLLVIMELMIYASARLINLALPLALLLSSIMTFGNLSEHNELTAMKSSGMSLIRIMRPLTVFIILLSIGSFLFSNHVWPISNLKFKTLLYSIIQQRPALNINEGVFYTDIEGFSIRVDKKDPDTGELFDVLIYNHRGNGKKNGQVIRAKRGKMQQTADKAYLVFTLYDGYSYNEQDENKIKAKDRKQAHVRNSFAENTLYLDLSSFEFNKESEDLFDGSQDMMSLTQLDYAIDSLESGMITKRSDIGLYSRRNNPLYRDTLNLQVASGGDLYFFDKLPSTKKEASLSKALELSNNKLNYLKRMRADLDMKTQIVQRYKIEWHRKLFLAFSCIALFFIGAPLGAIIRKGGLGWPTIIAIIIYVLYYIVTVVGEKSAKSGDIPAWLGMWGSSFLLVPIAALLTYKAANDIGMLDSERYKAIFDRLIKKSRPKTSDTK